MVQKGLCRDRPSFRSVKVKTKISLKQICCLNGVVWAVTDAEEIVYRTGTSPTMEGDGWQNLEGWVFDIALKFQKFLLHM